MHVELERHELAEARDVLEHVGVGRVEDVRPVGVQHRAALVALGVAVAADVVSGLEQVDVETGLGQLPGHHRPGEP